MIHTDYLGYDEEYDNNSSEINEDACYEFGGTEDDKNNTKTKTLKDDIKEALPYLAAIVLFCVGVFYISFKIWQ